MPEIIVIAHNIRSTHNIGSIFRTCEGFGVSKIILSGYSPYPTTANETRLPHISNKLTSQIHKTALGAETMVPFEHQESPDLETLHLAGFRIVGLEQDARSSILSSYKAPDKIALILGEEVHGLTKDLIDKCDDLIEIPMTGQKESFNVSVAAGVALYELSKTHL
ncbi:MAG TPA: TrmH family RNA methyltransferase [Candidatus Saccharibacteria bacterium]|nr:TrmH family RNA methyltransferase [Candidatus Saccharibacteria bacterium]HRQ06641.1 TrmH family RNA methyltransferase [Candidatus Saccharibacteria bacterium]